MSASTSDPAMGDERVAVALAFVRALEAGDPEALEMLCADDFSFTGLAPEPLDRTGFVELERGFFAATSDRRYEPELVERRDEDVELRIRVSARHTGELLGHLATQVRFALPEQRPVYTVRDGRVSAVVMPPVAGAGVDGILAQITADGG